MGDKIHRGETLSDYLEDVFLARDGEVALLDNMTLVQETSTQTGAVNTGTTTFPDDDFIKVITEGFEVMTLVHTPKDASNILEIQWLTFIAHSVGGTPRACLFQDAVTNTLATAAIHFFTANVIQKCGSSHRQVAGTISPITFRVRVGSGNAGTLTFNGKLATRREGGVMASYLRVKEYRP